MRVTKNTKLTERYISDRNFPDKPMEGWQKAARRFREEY